MTATEGDSRRDDRRVRPTLRCLVEDFHLALPGRDHDLSDVAHEAMDEARRLAPTTPRGQKPIECVPHQMVFRLQHSRWRGASWLDHDNDIMWVLGYQMRREDSHDDAYEYFCHLHDDGRLLPTKDDYDRDRAEREIRLLALHTHEIEQHVMESRYRAGEEVDATLSMGIHAILLIVPAGDLSEVWLAISRRCTDGTFLKATRVEMLFAQYSRVFGGLFEENHDEWPTGRNLEWYEKGWLGLA